MLHKSFKPAKCKTSLKLAISRMKLMKNKKDLQINQMKRDLAQLLETGQDRTARIRVEHVIREEKMVAAYELIEIYCELIVTRLPIIESQKTCPIDLKEAVTSVIFAAPRCSDISELSDIRKQFAAKFGKEFVSAALELRPDCGVSRMLVEKLSAVAPNLQTKIKVLSAAAKDHNIEWDPTSFEEKESKPPIDLLNGAPNFEKAPSIANADPPKIQPPSTSSVIHEEKQNAHFDFSEQNRKYTVGTQSVASTDDGGETSPATQADMRSSGRTSESMEMRPSWNMKFKDATAAAQAAAESAERAAMAARAAAQFSSQEKIANQHPHVSNVRDNTRRVSSNSGSIGENHSLESSSDNKNHKIVGHHTDQSEIASSQKSTERFDGPSYSGNTTSNIPTSFVSSNDSAEDEKLVSNVHMADVYTKESLHEDQKKGFSESKTDLESEHKGSFDYQNINFFAEEITKKQPSIHSSCSHSSSSSDELDVGKRIVVGNPFSVVDHENQFKEATKASSNVDFPVDGDDDAISNNDDDNGGPRFDTGFEYDEVEATHSLENAHIWSPRRNTDNTVDQPSSQSHLSSESLSFRHHSGRTMDSEADDQVPASFDDSDGPDSESESELAKSSFNMNPEPSSVESNYNSGKFRIELNDLVEVEPSSYNPEDEEKKLQSQPELKKHTFDQETYDEDNNDSLNQPDEMESMKELSFETLTGGLRNKGGLRYPPYTKSAAPEAESSITGGQTYKQNFLDSGVSKMQDKNPGIYVESSDSDSDSEKRSKHSITRSRFLPPDAVFDNDVTESEEEVSKQVPSRVRLGQGLSRRTRGSPTAPQIKSQVDPEPKTVISSFSEYRKPIQYSYADEDPVEPQNYARRFKEDVKHIHESQQPFSPSRRTAETGKNKSTISEPRVNHSANTKQEAVETMPEPKIPIREPVLSRNTVESVQTKHTKTPSLGSERMSGKNIVKKPSHVHPKLPDYDSLAARLQSMRTDHQ